MNCLITRGRIGDLSGVNGLSAKSLLSFFSLHALIITIYYSSQVTNAAYGDLDLL